MNVDVWTPRAIDLTSPGSGRGFHSLYAVARLKPGVSIAAFNAELTNIASQLSNENPAFDSGLHLQATLFRKWLSKDVTSWILILFAAVSAVLLMACINVSNLLLARSSVRMREMSIRISVGANRLSLLQQLLTESILLALVSSISGLAASVLIVRWIRILPSLNVPRPESITVDWRVVLFALLAAGLTGLTFGAFPAFKVSFTSIAAILKQAGGRATETKNQQFGRKALVALETLLATVLLIASLLLLRSFSEISKVDLGFQSDHLLTVYVSLNPARLPDTKDIAHFAHSVLEKLTGRPGIVSATFTTSVPLQGGTSGAGPVQVEGHATPANFADAPAVVNTGVSISYRRTLNIPLWRGLDLTARDERDETTSILVNSALAKALFPNGNAVGKRLRYSPNINPSAPWEEIVGVLADTPQGGPDSPVRPEIYRTLARTSNTFPAIIIRTSDSPLPHLRDIQTAIHQVDPELPLFLPRTMEQVEARRMGSRTFITTLLTVFAAVALLLASGGIFAVVAYSVSQRTSEIGIRIACGATHGDIIRLIVRQALIPAFIGIAVGLLAALSLSKQLLGLLYGVKTTDFACYAFTVLLMATFSTLAALLPARRAASVEPWKALRYE